MYKFLGRYVYNTDVEIHGTDLLCIVQKYCNRLQNAAIGIKDKGTGTAADPWKPKNIKDWFELACQVQKNKAVQYFCVAGRLIRRDIHHDLYFSDVGPAWKRWDLDHDPDVHGIAEANTTAELNRFAAAFGFQQGDEERFLEDASAADALAADHQRRIDRKKELSFNGSVAPTYRVGAQTMRSPENALPQNAAWAAEAKANLGGAWKVAAPLTWNDVTRQPAVIQAIRSMLNGGQIAQSKDYSRLQTALPVFVCCMFIAEPARNIRAFLINLILLDLAERYDFTIGDMLWHPEALDVDSKLAETPGWNGNNPVKADVMAPGAQKGASRTDLKKVDTLGNLHMAGGIMPASPTGGGKFATPALVGRFNSKRPPTVVDYIHQKEVSVLLQWLALKCPPWQARPGSVGKTLPDTAFGAIVHSDSDKVNKIPKDFFGVDAAASGVADLTIGLVELDKAIKDRLESADQQCH